MQDFEVFWVSRIRYGINKIRSTKKHSHAFYQFIYVISGEGEIVIDEHKHTAVASSVFIIRPNTEHSISFSKNSDMTTFEVKFKANSYWDREIESMPNKIAVNANSYQIVSMLEKIFYESVWKLWSYESVITSSFLLVLVHLERHLRNESAMEGKNPNLFDDIAVGHEAKMLDAIAEYINNNCNNSKITLAELSELAKCSETYLCRVFKKIYGMPPFQYINFLRLQKAKELLIHSSLNITEISESLGFQSIHYFSRYFTKKEGVSPIKYRQNVKGHKIVIKTSV